MNTNGMLEGDMFNGDYSHQAVERDKYLAFHMCNEEYALDILSVQEIRCWEQPTTLPNALPSFKGVINMRGEVVPIIDLRTQFGLPSAEYGAGTVVIILRKQVEDSNDVVMGVVVDGVTDVYNISEEELKPAPDIGLGQGKKYLKGIASVAEKMVVLIDVDKLLDPTSMNFDN